MMMDRQDCLNVHIFQALFKTKLFQYWEDEVGGRGVTKLLCFSFDVVTLTKSLVFIIV